MEPFSTNKEMGRILIRRGGETIAAGKYTALPMVVCCLTSGRCLFSRRCSGDHSLKFLKKRKR